MKHAYILMLAVFFCLTGCGEQTKEVSEKHLVPTGIMVPAAETKSMAIDITDAEAECLLEESFFYASRSFVEDAKGNKTAKILFCRKELADFEEEHILLEQHEGSNVRRMTLDSNANLYELILVEEGEKQIFYVGKWDSIGELVYKVPVTEVTGNQLYEVAGCIADAGGDLCLYTWDGDFFLFDKEGTFTGQVKTDMPLAENGAFITAMDDIYWYQDTGNAIDFYCLDMERGSMIRKGSFPLEGEGNGIPFVQGGVEGIWIGTDRGLYQYHPGKNDRKEVLLWLNPHINLDGSRLYLIEELETGQLQLLFGRLKGDWFTVDESAVISWVDEGLLTKKQIITLGTSFWNADNEELVRQFNRQSQEYAVELVFYFPRDEQGEMMEHVYMDILQKKAPDIIDVSGMDIMTMSDNGIFEDLEPYFKNSAVVRKKDILENVWKEGQLEGKYRMVFPFFTLSTYVTHDLSEGQGWTLEEYVQYAKEHPKTPLVYWMTYRRALGIALFGGMDAFVDYEKGTCDFAGKAFIELLKGIKTMNLVQVCASDDANINEIYKAFQAGEILMNDISFGSVEEFLKLQKQYGPASGWKGYPALSGEPCHEMQAQWRLVMNSSSEKKKGAWEFLEFLLSEEVQERDNSLISFPVRRETFEEKLEKAVDEEGNNIKQDIDILTRMVNSSHVDNTGIDDNIFQIICEESGAFFAGDKTAEETAQIIQNRVQLYLEEKKN